MLLAFPTVVSFLAFGVSDEADKADPYDGEPTTQPNLEEDHRACLHQWLHAHSMPELCRYRGIEQRRQIRRTDYCSLLNQKSEVNELVHFLLDDRRQILLQIRDHKEAESGVQRGIDGSSN